MELDKITHSIVKNVHHVEISMKKLVVLSSFAFILSGPIAFAAPATKVVCGKMTSIERTTEKSVYDVTLKLKFVQTGSIVSGKLKLGSAVQKSALKLTLYPTHPDNTMAAMITFSNLLNFHSIGGALCISFPKTAEALDSGFPYEFGTGVSVDKAAADLEAVQKFGSRS